MQSCSQTRTCTCAAAQRRLVALGNASAAPLKELVARQEGDQLARIHAIWALGSLAIGELQLFDAIAPLCSDGDAEIRTQAARTLGRARSASVAARNGYGAALAKLLADPSLRVRASAATSIGSLAYQPALEALLQTASENGDQGDPILRTAIVMGLSGSQSEVQLRDAAKGADQAARIALVLALAKQKSPRVGDFLNDESEAVVLEAARSGIPPSRPPTAHWPHYWIKFHPRMSRSCGVRWRPARPCVRLRISRPS